MFFAGFFPAPPVVVDGGVDVAVAGAGTVPSAGLTAEGLVAAAVGDVAELLDVDVDRFARPVRFVAAAYGLPAARSRWDFPTHSPRGGSVASVWWTCSSPFMTV